MGRGRAQQTIDLLSAAITILEEIQPCSVRAVCYRLFTLGLLTSMHKNETNKVSRLLTQGREQGEIPWDWIVDETRSVESGAPRWDDPAQYMRVVKSAYRKDHWALQPVRVEIWSEKGTIRGTLGPVLRELGVPFRVMHGYTSATAIHDIVTQQLASWIPWIVFYVGDFDPSGLHMSEADLPDRLHEYWLPMAFGCAPRHPGEDLPGIQLERIALSEADILDPNLPSFPLESKCKDPRHAWYAETVGDLALGRCWEVDALSPVVLRERVRAAILAELDQAQWQRSLLAEAAEQASLATYFSGWKSIPGQASQYEGGA